MFSLNLEPRTIFSWFETSWGPRTKRTSNLDSGKIFIKGRYLDNGATLVVLGSRLQMQFRKAPEGSRRFWVRDLRKIFLVPEAAPLYRDGYYIGERLRVPKTFSEKCFFEFETTNAVLESSRRFYKVLGSRFKKNIFGTRSRSPI